MRTVTRKKREENLFIVYAHGQTTTWGSHSLWVSTQFSQQGCSASSFWLIGELWVWVRLQVTVISPFVSVIWPYCALAPWRKDRLLVLLSLCVLHDEPVEPVITATLFYNIYVHSCVSQTQQEDTTWSTHRQKWLYLILHISLSHVPIFRTAWFYFTLRTLTNATKFSDSA
jgi:hypothetical protein